MEELKLETYKISFKDRIKRNLKKFKKYCYISLLSGSLLLVFLFTFTSLLRIYYLLSFIFASIISITLNFLLNRIYNFNNFNPKRLPKLYSEFLVISVASFSLNAILLYILVSIFKIFYLLAQFLIGILGLPILFLVHKKIVFNHR